MLIQRASFTPDTKAPDGSGDGLLGRYFASRDQIIDEWYEHAEATSIGLVNLEAGNATRSAWTFTRTGAWR